jgi:hypothetical protein
MAKDHLKKYFVMKPEVEKIFDDLEAYHDYCRFEMLRFDERDLYRSEAWRRSQGMAPRTWTRKPNRPQYNNR